MDGVFSSLSIKFSAVIEGEKLGVSAESSSDIDAIEFRDIISADILQFVQGSAIQNFLVERERTGKFFMRLKATERRRPIFLAFQCSGLKMPPKSCSGVIANCLEGILDLHDLITLKA